MPAPDRTPQGFPVISLEQAQRDTGQTAAQVGRLLQAVDVLLAHDDPREAYERVEQARAAIEWLHDRIAITDGGVLGRHRAPSSGDVAGATLPPD